MPVPPAPAPLHLAVTSAVLVNNPAAESAATCTSIDIAFVVCGAIGPTLSQVSTSLAVLLVGMLVPMIEYLMPGVSVMVSPTFTGSSLQSNLLLIVMV